MSDQRKRIDADRRLAERIRNGEDDAFEELVRNHHKRISRIAGRFFRETATIEDICQEVFVKAYSGMQGYRAEMPMEHWLARITANACYDQLRRRSKSPETSISEISGDPEKFYDRLHSHVENPAEDFLRKEEMRILAERILSRLAPADRMVITLMILEELSVSEVASLTGWSKANVKIRAFRARARLRKILESLKTGGKKNES